MVNYMMIYEVIGSYIYLILTVQQVSFIYLYHKCQIKDNLKGCTRNLNDIWIRTAIQGFKGLRLWQRCILVTIPSMCLDCFRENIIFVKTYTKYQCCTKWGRSWYLSSWMPYYQYERNNYLYYLNIVIQFY